MEAWTSFYKTFFSDGMNFVAKPAENDKVWKSSPPATKHGRSSTRRKNLTQPTKRSSKPFYKRRACTASSVHSNQERLRHGQEAIRRLMISAARRSICRTE